MLYSRETVECKHTECRKVEEKIDNTLNRYI